MGYRTSNAAVAYDMQPSFVPEDPRVESPRIDPRERLRVVTGEGRQADQAVSPAFTRVIKTFCVLIALFFVVGAARIAIAGVTAGTLNANAALSSSLETGRDESASLEVMRSVYSSPTRIRDLASSSMGLVDADETVTVDLSGTSASADAE